MAEVKKKLANPSGATMERDITRLSGRMAGGAKVSRWQRFRQYKWLKQISRHHGIILTVNTGTVMWTPAVATQHSGHPWPNSISIKWLWFAFGWFYTK